MAALGRAGFPVPAALEHNRHAVLMSLIPAVPLVQVLGTAQLLCCFLLHQMRGLPQVQCRDAACAQQPVYLDM